MNVMESPRSETYGQIPQARTSSTTVLSAASPYTQPPETASDEANDVDAMGSTLNCSPVARKSPAGYYGTSSSISFLNDVYIAIGRGVPSSASDTTAAIPVPLKDSSTELLGSDSPDRFILPPRHTMDGILDVYWQRIHHLYPFIHRPTFQAAYEKLWLPAGAAGHSSALENGMLGSKRYGPDSVVFHCALNAIAALSCHFMEPRGKNRTRLADAFGERSRSLCHLDLFDEGSLAFVQTLLLIAQYLQSTPFPSRCWNCIGIACRLAQGMGLHVESPDLLSQLTAEEIDMRRRVWHGCVTLDAVVSMTLGRPLMLHKADRVPLPQLLQRETALGHVRPVVVESSHTDFFLESCKLYAVLRDIVSELYQKSEDKAGGYDAIIAFDAAISTLEDKLPSELRPHEARLMPEDTTGADICLQQAYVLQARRLHLRILLYRPTFTRHCQSLCAQSGTQAASPEVRSITEASSGLSQALSEACVERATQLIETVHESMSKSATGAWWYNLFYTRTAGVVILFAMACPSLFSSASNADRLLKAWELCQTVLADLEKLSSRVSPCMRQLEALQNQIQKSWSKQEQLRPPPRNQMRHDGIYALQTTPAIATTALFDSTTDHANFDAGGLGVAFPDENCFEFDLTTDFDWEAFLSNTGI
ncbi:uncharacterized protein HMPREF1541_05877 [Cyphellophora europaea CBS 101466]|uniref:Xylanolytic transcriptional activator regulatory domain-containing protein n=1 Tax=Cyphellophora europaea (strain CBS 101466) TaxID=1220924 RepID=W2RT03_CYPE1|nr:uncharacterized protein HMPREF1541_05877 [Cyphellophora europaea CBS 101466]ETN39651.1 hypothetical protein HMPREF1541_05877 [Cyphellophora europaea CBS 101466]